VIDENGKKMLSIPPTSFVVRRRRDVDVDVIVFRIEKVVP
jgi:hypothetical protein